MAELIAASLDDGQLSDSIGTIFEATAPTVIKQVNFANTSASLTESIVLYVTRSGGTRRKLQQLKLDPNGAAQYLSAGDTMALSAGDVLEAVTTTAATVDYFISGASS